MNFWAKVAVCVLWIFLFCWWLSPEVEGARDRITDHHKQIQKALEE